MATWPDTDVGNDLLELFKAKHLGGHPVPPIRFSNVAKIYQLYNFHTNTKYIIAYVINKDNVNMYCLSQFPTNQIQHCCQNLSALQFPYKYQVHIIAYVINKDNVFFFFEKNKDNVNMCCLSTSIKYLTFSYSKLHHSRSP